MFAGPDEPALRTTQSLHAGARHAVARRLRGALRGARPRVPRPGHHVLRTRAGGAAVPARPRAPHHRRRRVGGRRVGRAPAGARARAVPGRRVRARARSSPTASCRAGWWPARRTTTAACTASIPSAGVRIHVAGVDLVRDGAGSFRVLEDNLRTPSGISYVVENRRAMTHVFPELFASHRIRRVADYPLRLLEAFRATAPPGVDDPCVVVLSPGIHNAAYFEHSFLARQMGVELVEGRDLVCRDQHVYMRTTGGRAARRRRVPARRRRLPRPAALPARLGARVRGHPQRGARRQRHDRQRAGQRCRRRQGRSTRTSPR